MFEVRRAKPEDKEPIWKVYLSAVGSRARRNDIYWDQLIHAGGMFVAETDGRIIGFGGLDVSATEQVKYLYILPEYQAAGIGSKLLKKLERIGWEAGLNSLRLHSAPGAVEFYKRRGYRVVEAGGRTGHDHEGVEMVKEGDDKAVN